MNSRSDGAMANDEVAPLITVASGERVEASFVRYAPTDPLCCPSRGRTRVTYQIQRDAGGPVLTPIALTADPAAAMPSRLPQTGVPGATLPLAAGAVTLALAGAVHRFRRAVGSIRR
jgi:LPXTG-motif cell wall-anchored protein